MLQVGGGLGTTHFHCNTCAGDYPIDDFILHLHHSPDNVLRIHGTSPCLRGSEREQSLEGAALHGDAAQRAREEEASACTSIIPQQQLPREEGPRAHEQNAPRDVRQCAQPGHTGASCLATAGVVVPGAEEGGPEEERARECQRECKHAIARGVGVSRGGVGVSAGGARALQLPQPWRFGVEGCLDGLGHPSDPYS